MDADKAVVAKFYYVMPFRYFLTANGIYGFFNDIQTAFGNVTSDGDVIQVRGGVHPGALTANNGLRVIIRGGYDTAFGTRTEESVINGKVTVQSGMLVMDGVRIR
jgi:hypothetical protein